MKGKYWYEGFVLQGIPLWKRCILFFIKGEWIEETTEYQPYAGVRIYVKKWRGNVYILREQYQRDNTKTYNQKCEG